jgi:hypothetical protein
VNRDKAASAHRAALIDWRSCTEMLISLIPVLHGRCAYSCTAVRLLVELLVVLLEGSL